MEIQYRSRKGGLGRSQKLMKEAKEKVQTKEKGKEKAANKANRREQNCTVTINNAELSDIND